MSERSRVRRRDRAMDDAWVRAFLEAAPFGFLATVADGQPFLNSNLFVYDPDRHALYLHTARTGRVNENLGADRPRSDADSRPRDADPPRPPTAPVCFSVATMGRILPADEALEFSVEYASVVVFGRGRVVEDDAEAEVALQLLLDRYAPHLRPGRDYRPITVGELRRTAVYRIDVEEWSGKQKAVAADFPGAFAVDRPTVPFPG